MLSEWIKKNIMQPLSYITLKYVTADVKQLLLMMHVKLMDKINEGGMRAC
jgi:hypothetical protein